MHNVVYDSQTHCSPIGAHLRLCLATASLFRSPHPHPKYVWPTPAFGRLTAKGREDNMQYAVHCPVTVHNMANGSVRTGVGSDGGWSREQRPPVGGGGKVH